MVANGRAPIFPRTDRRTLKLRRLTLSNGQRLRGEEEIQLTITHHPVDRDGILGLLAPSANERREIPIDSH